MTSDAELERDYWRKRAEDAERKERAAMLLAMNAEGECDSLRVTLAATRAELDGLLVRMANENRAPRRIEGTLPADDLRRAFADGAAWWEFNKSGFSMWNSDRREAEVEAEARYPNGKLGPTYTNATECDSLRAKLTELESALEIYEHDTDYKSAEQGCS